MPTTFKEIPRERPTTPLLDRAETPDGLRRLGEAELEALADELRLELLYTVGQTGGHFGAGLGVIELTIALHYVFDTPDDRLVWDVGHQAYPHKILTGRRERMGTLRQKDGLAAFPRRAESEYDTFGVGHSSTSISAALGMAIAARLQGSARKAIAVIGDGALTAGMAFEALNHAPEVDANMLVILNDNDMSISRNVGGLSNYLAKILSSRTYASMREGSKKVLSRLPGAWEIARRTEEYAKGMLVPGTLAALIQSISNAAQQQTSSAGQISLTMNVIQQITTQTSSGSTATAESIGNLAKMASQLRRSVSGFTLPTAPAEVTDKA